MNVNTFLKEILFSTVRIISGQSVGTGFLILKKIDENQHQIFLITNKHVIAKMNDHGEIIEKYSKGSFSFIKDENNNPKLGESFTITIENLTDSFIFHPEKSVDLAICNISEVYNQITKNLKQNIFIRGIPLEMIPNSTETFDAIEDIIFVGYPNDIFDRKNHLPIIRRGITASPFEIDFDGNKKFIIDAHVFPGSSGSPIFIKESHMKNGTLRLGSDRYFFAGIVSKVFFRNETGKIVQSAAPTNFVDNQVLIKQMVGLGICEKSNQILKLIEIINTKNITNA